MSKTWITAALLAAAGATATVAALPALAQDGRGPGPRDGLRMERFFERFDANGDGVVTQAEIEAGAAERFARTDTDGDGRLTAEEIVAAAEARRMEQRMMRAERMVERLDTDGDGALSGDEIAGARGGDRLDRIFDMLDADNDGQVTEAEFADASGMMRRLMADRHGHGHGPRGGDRD